MRFAYVIHGCISVARGRPFLRILRPRHLYIRVRQMPEATMDVGEGVSRTRKLRKLTVISTAGRNLEYPSVQ